MASTTQERGGPKRRNRAPDFTQRDGAAIGWLAEMYGARYDVLGVLLGRLAGERGPLSRWGVRNQIDRWKRQDLVTVERVMGQSWVTPTKRGLDKVGSDLGVWAVPITRVRHCHAVNALRLAYEATPQAEAAPWVCERHTFKERGKDRWHIPDGVVQDPKAPLDGPVRHMAFEVELTHKTRKALANEVFLNLRAGTETLLYYVETEDFADRLRTDIRAVQNQTKTTKDWRVSLLPEVEGVEYMTTGR